MKNIFTPKYIWNKFSLSLLFSLMLMFVVSGVWGQVTYTWNGSTSTAWNNTANWTKSSGTSTPGTAATDIVVIPTTATNQPTLSTALSTSIASLTFTSTTAATLTITGQTLNVTGVVTLNNNVAGTNTACNITGTGTLSCASVAVGLTTVAPSNTPTAIMTSSINVFTISGTLALNSSRNSGVGTNRLNPTFVQSGGTVNVGNITTTVTTFGQTDAVTCTYTMSGTTPILNITGTTPFTLDATPTNTFTLNSTNATVNYTNAGAQTIGVSGNAGTLTYNNLGVSGGNTKTLAANTTANRILTVNAGTTLALSTFTLRTPTSVVLEGGATTGSSITGTGALTLGGNVTVNDAAGAGTSGASISAPLALGATRTFTVADDGTTAVDLSITSIVSGGAGIIKTGLGTMNLSASNTYTGATTITQGILRASSNVVTASNGAFGNSASAANNIILNGGTIESNTATFSKTITVAITNSRLDAFGSARTISATITRNAAGTVNLNVGGTTAASAEGQGLTLSGTINNTSGTLNLTKIGTSTVILSGSNSYSGTTTITQGILRANSNVIASTNGAFGNTASNSATILNGGTLQSNTATISRGIIINATNSTIDAFGSVRTISANISQNGAGIFNLNIGGNTVASAEGQDLTLSGTISNTTGTLSLTKIGTSTALVSGTNTFGGSTTISSGTVFWNSNGALSTGPVTINDVNTGSNNVSLFRNSTGTLSNNITVANQGTGTVTIGNNSGAVTGVNYTGNIVLNKAATFTSGTSSSGGASFNTGIISGSGLLTIIGSGAVTLSGSNTFTGGTTLSAGTLNINNTQALGTVAGTFTINGGTTINNSSGADITTLNYPLALNGNFIYSGSVPRNLNLGTGATTLNADRQITVTAGTLTIGGIISASTRSLTKAGAGNLSFGSNAISLNSLTISSGILTSTSNSLTLAGNFSNNSTFSNNSGTSIFDGTTQSLTGATTFQNLVFSGSGTKTLNNVISVDGNLSIASSVKANLSTVTHSANSFTLGGGGTPSGSWGSASSSATYKSDIYFENTGIFNIAIGTCGTITINSAIKTSYNGSDLSCSNSTDGEITVTASGGTGTLQYSKDNGTNYQLSNVFSGLAAGTYEIVVKDANNCLSTTTVSVTITAPPVLSGTISSQTNVLCVGSATGSVTVDGSGGTGSYTYSLNGGTYQVSNTFNGLSNGSYTVTVKDANNCTVNVPVTILATDNIAPVITCPADININNTPGLCTGSIDLTGVATATDNCTVASISYSPAGPVFSIGTTLVTVTATDNNGNSSTCTFSVIVVDNEGSAITCPADTTVLTDFTVCTYTLADFTTLATANDNCGGAVTLTQSPVAGTILNSGIHTITITALDVLNNSSTCTFNLTVDSNIADKPLYIDGPINACPFIDSTITANYIIPVVANANSYYWTVPTGATIISGQGTTGIVVSYNNAFVGETNITVVAISACDSSAVTVLKIRKDVPGIPYRIRGTAELCPFAGTGVNSIYYIEPVRYATAYIWVVPAGATIVSGQGDTLIEVSYAGSIISGTISVYATNYCYTSTARILNVAKTLPPVPGAISGESDVCPIMGTGTPTTYSISPVTEAISYTWSVPAGASIVSGQGTTSISVLFSNAFVSGSILVNSVSDCGNSNNRSFVLTRRIPSIPAVIAGVTDACPLMGTGTPTSYTILPVTNATSYLWTVPSGVTILSGQGTTSINVTYSNSFVSGNITVAAQNNCFTSAAKTLTVSRAVPATPGTISGPTDACPLMGTGAQSTYSISPVTNATSYVWTVPTGAAIVSGQGTTSIIVTYANSFVNAGFITVAAQNNCSVSAAKSLTILRNAPATPGVITGPSNICTLIGSPTNAVYSVAGSAFATSYTWSLPIGATIIGASNGSSITVSFSNSFVPGTLYVSAINNCAASGFRSLAIVKVPAAPGTITAAPQACPSRNVVYSITPVAGAVSYIWTKPAGTVFTGDSTLSSVTVTYPVTAVTGTVSVKATNTCGTSAVKSLAVSVAACPPLTKKPGSGNGTEANTVITDKVLPVYKINPNPTVSSFRIDMKNKKPGDFVIKVTDVYGRIIETQTFKNNPSFINIGTGYVPGVYFAEILQAGASQILKLIKQ